MRVIVSMEIKLSASGLMNIINQQYYQYTGMSMQQHMTEAHRRRGREGRWTPAEADLFEELIQKYGKNWKKIQSFIRGRSLSQIRSHAQKFFRKVGEGRVREFERKAKLLEALDTLQKEKLRQASGAERQNQHEMPTGKEIQLQQSVWSGSRGQSEPMRQKEEEGELRAFESKAIKEQFSLDPNNQSQAPVVQTPTIENENSKQINQYMHQSYLPYHPGFSYYFVAPQQGAFYPGFNFPMNQ